MANKQLAQIETMLADRAPQLGDYDAVESVKRILDERDEANKSKDAMLYAALCDMPSPLVQEVVDTLELWLNDGRFYVANSAPAEQSVRRLEQLIAKIRKVQPRLKSYEGPHKVFEKWNGC